MAESLGTAVLDLRADGAALKRDLADAEKEAGGRLAGIQKRADKWGKNLTKTVTLPFLALTAGSLKLASDVDKGLREVNTLFGETGAAAEKNFQEMREEVADFSKELGISQKVAVKGLYQAISAGVPKDNVFDFMRTAGKAAIGGNTDVETSIDGITTYLNAFGLEASQAEAVADSMLQAVADGKTTFEEMSKAAFNVAPAAAAAGVSFQEVNASIATLTKSGTPTSVATTQMRAALDGLQKPSEELDKIFQDLGYQNAQVALESEGLTFALGAVKDASKGNNGTLQQLLGSTEAVAAANVIAGTGADVHADHMANQQKAAGNVDKAFAEMEQSTARQMERLKVGLENLGISIGNILLPWLNKMVGVGQKVSDWLNGMSDGQRKAVVGVGMFAAALGPALIITGKFVGALRSAAKTLRLAAAAKWVAAKAQAAYNAVLNANPMMRIVTVLSLLAAGLVVAYQRSETFRAIVDAAFSAVASAAGALWGFMQQTWTDIKAGAASLWVEIQRAGGGIMNIFRAIGGAAVWLWTNAIQPAWTGITTVTGVLWSAVKMYFTLWKTIITTLARTAMWLWQNVVKSAWDGIATITRTLWSVIQRIGALIESAWRGWGRIATTIKNTIKTAWEGITTATRALWNGVISPIAGFIRTAIASVGTAATTMKNTVKTAFEAIRDNVLRPIWNGVLKPAFDKMRNPFDAVKGAAAGMRDGIKGAFDFIRDHVITPAARTFATLANGFIKAANRIGSGASKIAGVISRIPGVDISFTWGKISELPVPKLAEGDVVRRPTLAMIGEDGPEAVIPLGAKRRKRGQELMTRAALMMGMPGMDPSSGLKFMAEGGIAGTGRVGTTMEDLLRGIDIAAQSGGPNVFQKAWGGVKGAASSVLNLGAKALIKLLPDIGLGSGPWADFFKDLPGRLLKRAASAIKTLFKRSSEAFGFEQIKSAKEKSEGIMGLPYGWGAGRPPGWGHSAYDCSGYASTAWWEASGKRGYSGTTMSLFPISKRARGGEPFQFVFRGMTSSDPRQQHMGARILGDEYDFGDPGMKNRGRPWDHSMVPPFVPGFAEGTDRITREGLAYLHRDEAVVPAAENGRRRTIIERIADHVHFHEPSDADRILGDLGNRFAVRAGAM